MKACSCNQERNQVATFADKELYEQQYLARDIHDALIKKLHERHPYATIPFMLVAIFQSFELNMPIDFCVAAVPHVLTSNHRVFSFRAVRLRMT